MIVATPMSLVREYLTSAPFSAAASAAASSSAVDTPAGTSAAMRLAVAAAVADFAQVTLLALAHLTDDLDEMPGRGNVGLRRFWWGSGRFDTREVTLENVAVAALARVVAAIAIFYARRQLKCTER